MHDAGKLAIEGTENSPKISICLVQQHEVLWLYGEEVNDVPLPYFETVLSRM
jgi:hypothetical protein